MKIGDRVTFKDGNKAYTITEVLGLFAHTVGYVQETVYKVDDGSTNVYKGSYLDTKEKFKVGDFIATREDAAQNPIRDYNIWEITAVNSVSYFVKNVGTKLSNSWSRESADRNAAIVKRITTWVKA